MLTINCETLQHGDLSRTFLHGPFPSSILLQGDPNGGLQTVLREKLQHPALQHLLIKDVSLASCAFYLFLVRAHARIKHLFIIAPRHDIRKYLLSQLTPRDSITIIELTGIDVQESVRTLPAVMTPMTQLAQDLSATRLEVSIAPWCTPRALITRLPRGKAPAAKKSLDFTDIKVDHPEPDSGSDAEHLPPLPSSPPKKRARIARMDIDTDGPEALLNNLLTVMQSTAPDIKPRFGLWSSHIYSYGSYNYVFFKHNDKNYFLFLAALNIKPTINVHAGLRKIHIKHSDGRDLMEFALPE